MHRIRAVVVTAVAVVVLASVATGCITAASVTAGTLTITGSGGNDTIVLRLKAGDPTVLEVDDRNDGTADRSFDRSTFTSIVLDGAGGNDTLVVDQANGVFTDTEATTLRGGEGDDTLVGGSGPETLEGDPGRDALDGNAGTDTLGGGDDADSFTWAPGDGSDSVDGGPGADHLDFAGSNAAEIFTLSASAGHAVLTRNIANIVMDLVGVESLDLALLGGTDIVTVGNLSGTGLASVTADLASSLGTDDGATDQITVPPSTSIGRDGGAATVSGSGVGALVRVVDGSPNDRLTVNGTAAVDAVLVQGTANADVVGLTAGASDLTVSGITPGVTTSLVSIEQVTVDLGSGNDQFAASGNVAALASLTVVGGPGRDTIGGGNGDDLLVGGPGADDLDGNQGTDTILAGDDDDVVRWDPGDGNDTIDGGGGSDQLTFEGANVSEVIDVSASAGHVRLTRNVANIVLDLTDVEATRVDLVGGADNLAVHDLTGTALAYVELSLGLTPGSATGDGNVDQITVDGTSGDDAIEIAGVDATVEVTGLPATVRVTGVELSDTLIANGMAGADTITATPSAKALIALSLLP